MARVDRPLPKFAIGLFWPARGRHRLQPGFDLLRRMNSQIYPRLKYWLPAILVAVVISVFSTHYFSSERTGHLIIPVLHWLFPAASPRLLHLFHIGIRKLAHVTEFGVFSVAIFHGVRGDRTGWQFNWALITLLIAIAYAGLDEWHQTFVPLREARLRDVAIDAFGALLAQSFVWIYSKWKGKGPASPGLAPPPAQQ
jgi:VanZ family protein